MPITITTNHGEFTAPTLTEVIAQEYGDRARAMRSGDPNDPRWGLIVETSDGGYHVLAQVIRIEGDDDAHSGEEAIAAAEDAHDEVQAHEAATSRAIEARNQYIRQAVRAGVTQAEMCERLGLSRSQMRNIIHRL